MWSFPEKFFGDARYSPDISLNLSACMFLICARVLCLCVCVCVLVSVCVSVWSVAEGSVSSNLGQTRDGKVNSAVKHRDRDTDTQTHTYDIETDKHT